MLFSIYIEQLGSHHESDPRRLPIPSCGSEVKRKKITDAHHKAALEGNRVAMECLMAVSYLSAGVFVDFPPELEGKPRAFPIEVWFVRLLEKR